MPQHARSTGSTTAQPRPGRRPARSPRAGAALGAALLSASVLFGFPGAAAAVASPATKAPPPQGAQPIAVTVRAADHRLDLPKRHFVPGPYVITVINSGSEPHALAVDGPAPGWAATPVLRPGESTQLTFTMREGRYEFYCPVGTHREQGMRVAVTVS